MDIPISDPNWIDANKELIGTWSPVVLLSTLLHSNLFNGNFNIYPDIIDLAGYTTPEQIQAINILGAFRSRIKDLVWRIQDDYYRQRMGDWLYNPTPPQEVVQSAIEMLHSLHDELLANATIIRETGQALSRGEYSFSNDTQRKLLQKAYELDEGLLTTLSYLSMWIAAQKD